MMDITQETAIDQKAQEAFWHKLQQYKFDLYYYGNQYKYCVTVLNLIKYIVAGLTTASTLIWIEFSDKPAIPSVCSLVILVLQVFNTVSALFPYNNRKDELRDLTNELNPLYLEMEKVWRRIAEGELSIPEIYEYIDNFANRRFQMGKNVLKNDSLPERKRIIQKSETQTQDYFATFM